MSEAVFCPGCGRLRAPDHSFCPGCGRSFVALTPYVPRTPSPERRSDPWVIDAPARPLRATRRATVLGAMAALFLAGAAAMDGARAAGPPYRISAALDRRGLDPFGAGGRLFPSPTPTFTPTATPTSTPTVTPTSTSTPTATSTATPTATSTPTFTPTPRPTSTFTPVPTDTPRPPPQVQAPQAFGPVKIETESYYNFDIGYVAGGTSPRLVVGLRYNNGLSNLFGTPSVDVSVGTRYWSSLGNGAVVDWQATQSGDYVVTVSNTSNITAKVVTLLVYR